MAYDRLVILDDVGRSLTFRAGRVISGGFLVGWSTGEDIVTSGGTFGGYAWNDVTVDAGSVATNNFVGIAMTTAASGADVSIATEGIFVLQAGDGGIVGGELVQVDGAGSNMVDVATGSAYFCGRGLSKATANTGFAVVKLI